LINNNNSLHLYNACIERGISSTTTSV